MPGIAAARAEPTCLAEMHARKVEADRRQAHTAARRMAQAIERQRVEAEAKRRAREARAEAEADRAREVAAVLASDTPASDPERAALDALVFQVLDPERIAREPRRIIARTVALFGFTRDEVLSPRRTRAIVRARWAAIAAVKAEHPGFTLPKLGRIFGRDHTAILHALRRMAERGVPQPPSAEPRS